MRLRKLAGLFSTHWREPSVCEACDGEFTCSASLAGCWCSTIKLSDETLTELKARYRNCLCRKCLEKAAKQEQRPDRQEACNRYEGPMSRRKEGSLNTVGFLPATVDNAR